MLNIHQMKFLTEVVLKDIEEKLAAVEDPEQDEGLLEFKKQFEQMKDELELLILIEQLEAVKDLEESL